MSEHRIKLRRGWQNENTASGERAGGWLALPVRWDAGAAGLLRISRRFGRPEIDAFRQALFLEIDHAPGIQAIQLNGKTLAALSPGKSYYLLPVPEIEERNTLLLEVDTAVARAGGSQVSAEWGNVALVIRSLDVPATT